LSALSTNEPETSTLFTLHVPTVRPGSLAVIVVVTVSPTFAVPELGVTAVELIIGALPSPASVFASL